MVKIKGLHDKELDKELACRLISITCEATVATSLNTEFSMCACSGSGSGCAAPDSARIRLQANSSASAGSVPRFRFTRKMVVPGSMTLTARWVRG